MAEGARLESVWAGNRLVGSNPTPSATRGAESFEVHKIALPELMACGLPAELVGTRAR